MEMTLQPIHKQPIIASELIALRAIDAVNAELRARNEERLKAVKEAMGERYVLHPANSPKKQSHKGVLDKKENDD